nr:helicase-related protein [Accumulibacter sp.]
MAENRQTVVFATDIAHSKMIVAAFELAGIKAAHIDYHFDDDERRLRIEAFAAGETKVLVNPSLLTEGWDCPSAEVIVLARPTRSRIRYLQMVGRVLRPFPGKTEALLLDHSGTVVALGYPTDDVEIALDGGERVVQERQARDKPTKAPSACPKCKFVRKPGVHVCDKCGFAPERQSEVATLSGDLERITRGVGEFEDADYRQSFYSQLLAIAAIRAFKPGWARHRYHDRFGHYPKNLAEVTEEPSVEVQNWATSRRIAWQKRGAALRRTAVHRHLAPSRVEQEVEYA